MSGAESSAATGDRRPRRRPGENRAGLISAGTVEFGLRGYSAAQTSAIAHRAGVSQPNVYANFRSKRDLFLACLAATRDALRDGDVSVSGTDSAVAPRAPERPSVAGVAVTPAATATPQPGAAGDPLRGAATSAAGAPGSDNALGSSDGAAAGAVHARLIFQAVAAVREPLLAPELATLLTEIRTTLGPEAFEAHLIAAARSLITPDQP